MLSFLLRLLASGLLAMLAGFAAAQVPLQTSEPPAIMLAAEYQPGEAIHLPDYWVSEKLDGVRARWDGQRLLSRGGKVIAAPAWFTQGWPAMAMDGELWSGRGRFEQTAGIVARATPRDEDWRGLRFMVFDLPEHGGRFSERVAAMRALQSARPHAHWRVIEQRRGSTERALQRQLDQLVQAGGEGLVLHRGDAYYRSGRSGDLLKFKPFQDAEAQVLAHVPGEGRNAGRLGALRVQTPDGRIFHLGTGFSDAERDHPPPVGVWVTYRYRGLTEKGLPRFATYLRVRADAELGGIEGR